MLILAFRQSDRVLKITFMVLGILEISYGIYKINETRKLLSIPLCSPPENCGGVILN